MKTRWLLTLIISFLFLTVIVSGMVAIPSSKAQEEMPYEEDQGAYEEEEVPGEGYTDEEMMEDEEMPGEDEPESEEDIYAPEPEAGMI